MQINRAPRCPLNQSLRQQTRRSHSSLVSMMEADEKTVLGPVNGKFTFKKRPDGTVDRSTVLCNSCSKWFSYHGSTSSLKYHLNAKHLAASSVLASSAADAKVSDQSCQGTLDQAFRRRMSKSTCDRLTNSITKWIAMDCRPISVVDDRPNTALPIRRNYTSSRGSN